MRVKIIPVLTLALFTSRASGYLQMIEPAPFGSSQNPWILRGDGIHRPGGDVDDKIRLPLKNFEHDVCKGGLGYRGTSYDNPVATWPTNSIQTFTLESKQLESHEGSCQASISVDLDRKEWVVLHSYIGKCSVDQPMPFRIPSDVPFPPDVDAMNAVFAWTWFNKSKSGRGSMFMNCASVRIEKTLNNIPEGEREIIPFGDRPQIFIGNTDDTSCTTEENFILEFPAPGNDVTRGTSMAKPPTCTVTASSSTNQS